MARKNPIKESLIMLVAAAALLSLYVWVLRPYLENRKVAADKSQLLYSNASREKILEFSISRDTNTYHVKKQADSQNNKWMVSQEAKSFEADATIIDGFFSTVLGAKIEKKLENAPALESIGLATPKFKLSVKGEGLSDTRELWLGIDTPVDYFTYAKWNDSPEVMLVSRSLRFALDKNSNDWRTRKIFNINPESLSKLEIKVARLDKHPVTYLAFSQENGTWKAAPKMQRLDPVEIKQFLDKLAATQVSNFVSQDPKDKIKYGFNNPIASVIVTPSDANKAPERWVLSSVYDAKTKSTKYYLFRQDLDETFEVAESVREAFRVDLMKFRNKKIYIPVPDQIFGIKIQTDQGSVKLQRKDKQWFVKGGEDSDDNLVPGKNEIIEKLVQILSELQVQEFYDGLTPYALGLQNPARIVEVSNQTDGKEIVVSTLFFGKKLGQPQVTTLRSEGMDAAGRVAMNVDSSLRVEPSYWAQNAIPEKAAPAVPPAGSSGAEKTPQNSLDNSANQGEKKKMKLEPTAKTTAELKKLPAAIIKKGFKYTAEMTLNNGKKIVITFDAAKAPYTVSNFLHLARNGFYNNVQFHRVIPRFVVQGGDPTGSGRGGPGWMFDNEDNDLKHVKGSISMAHAGRNTNGSQFFLVLDPQSHLDGVHTVFGSITQGIDVMEGIKQGDTMKTVEVFEEAQ